MPAASRPRVRASGSAASSRARIRSAGGQRAVGVAEVETGVDRLRVAGRSAADGSASAAARRRTSRAWSSAPVRAEDHAAQPPGPDLARRPPGPGAAARSNRSTAVAGLARTPGRVTSRRPDAPPRLGRGGTGRRRVRRPVAATAYAARSAARRGHAVHRLGHRLVRPDHRLGPVPGAPVGVRRVDRSARAARAARGGGRATPCRTDRERASGCTKRTRSPSTLSSPALSTAVQRGRGGTPAAEQAPADQTRGPRRRPPRARGGQAPAGRARPRGRRTSRDRAVGIGVGPSGGSRRSRSASAASSMMASGFPPPMARIRRTSSGLAGTARGLGELAPGRLVVESGQTSAAAVGRDQRHGARPRGGHQRGRRRRAAAGRANTRASCEGRSSRWASSTSRQSGWCSLRWVTRLSSPAPTANRSARRPGAQGQRDAEGLRLGRRQSVAGPRSPAQQLGQPGERQVPLGLGAGDRQDAHVRGARSAASPAAPSCRCRPRR